MKLNNEGINIFKIYLQQVKSAALMENLKGDMFKASSKASRQELQPRTGKIQKEQDLVDHVKALMKVGVVMDLSKDIIRGTAKSNTSQYSDYNISQRRHDALQENWSTMLFRGHKVLDPFSKTGDSKAVGDKVYWAKSPQTALLYSTMNSQWGTSGQQYTNILQKAFGQQANSGNQTQYKIGYFSIAKPKHPDQLHWYNNFGVEDKQAGYNMQGWENRKQNLQQNFPVRDVTSKDIPYQKQFEFNPEYANYIRKYGQLTYPHSSNKVVSDAETALSQSEVAGVRTYIVFNLDYGSYKLIPIAKIKQLDPELYSVLMKDSLQ